MGTPMGVPAVGCLACVCMLVERCSDGHSFWHAGCPVPSHLGEACSEQADVGP